MFICVSPNPAIDKRLHLASFVPGQVNRARTSQGFAGGKATHVAMVLRTLGELPQWIGPCGGATGDELLAGLAALGIKAHPCCTSTPTRTNLEIIEDRGRVTEILEPGAALGSGELAEFENACRNIFFEYGKSASTIFSGSLPPGVAPDLYHRLIASAKRAGCRTFVDTGGDALRLALAGGPDFVKPNREEAGALLGKLIGSIPEAARTVRELLVLGARSAAISLGADGLLFCPGKDAPIFFAAAPVVEACSTVGCGDSALAGFAQAVAMRESPENALRLAAACAAANCIAKSPGAAELADIEEFRSTIQVQTIKLGW